MSAPTWPAMHGRTYARAPGLHGQAELAGGEAQRRVERERERRAAELGRVDPEEEVMHHRVADERHLEDVRPLDRPPRGTARR